MVSRIKELKKITKQKGLGGWTGKVVQGRVDIVSLYQLPKSIDYDNLQEDGKHTRIVGKKDSITKEVGYIDMEKIRKNH